MRRATYAGISFNSPNLNYGQALDMHPRAVVQNETMLALLILSGRYVGFLPDHMAAQFEESGQMRKVLPEEIHYRTCFAAATRRSPEPNRLTREFLKILERHHRKHVETGTGTARP